MKTTRKGESKHDLKSFLLASERVETVEVADILYHGYECFPRDWTISIDIKVNFRLIIRTFNDHIQCSRVYHSCQWFDVRNK